MIIILILLSHIGDLVCHSFDYRSVIGKLKYLKCATCSDIAYATHMCACFVSQPKMKHGQAVRWLGWYLKGTRDKGTILKPDKSKGLEVYVDADFARNWDSTIVEMDLSIAHSCHSYILMYCRCPLMWASQLQIEIALSSCETEFISLSHAL